MMRGLSLTYIAAKFGVFVEEIIASFICYTGFINVIRYPISRVLLLILVLVVLRSCQYFGILPDCD